MNETVLRRELTRVHSWCTKNIHLAQTLLPPEFDPWFIDNMDAVNAYLREYIQDVPNEARETIISLYSHLEVFEFIALQHQNTWLLSTISALRLAVSYWSAGDTQKYIVDTSILEPETLAIVLYSGIGEPPLLEEDTKDYDPNETLPFDITESAKEGTDISGTRIIFSPHALEKILKKLKHLDVVVADNHLKGRLSDEFYGTLMKVASNARTLPNEFFSDFSTLIHSIMEQTGNPQIKNRMDAVFQRALDNYEG